MTEPVRIAYIWPTPLGIIFWITGLVAAKFFDPQVFRYSHALFEFGIVVALFASIACAIRLSGTERSLAPRWVFFLNLAFVPLIFGLMTISAIISSTATR